MKRILLILGFICFYYINLCAENIKVPVYDAFSQGFESNTDGWITFISPSTNYGSILKVSSGTDGITSKSGSYHAKVGHNSSGPFTRFDKYRSKWPDGGWKAKLDVYLDPSWTLNSGFDLSVAANKQDGSHLRDFIFHVCKDQSTGSLLIGGSNNTNFAVRQDLETINHYTVTSAGWYIFEFVFRNQSGQLAVDLNLRNSSNTLLWTETRTSASDLIASVVGGNRYMWFTFISITGDLHIDNTELIIYHNTIQSAINAANAGDVVIVDDGTYNENININKSVTLLGTNANIPCGSRGAESKIAPASGLPVSVTSDGVTINGFEITAPSYQYAISCGNTNDISIIFNKIHDVGNNVVGTSSSRINVHSIIYMVSNSVTTSNVFITDNCFNTIGNFNNPYGSTSAIGVLQSTSTGILNNLSIERNTIDNVKAKIEDWTNGGRIAYGIIINVGSNGYLTTNGKVVNAVIKNNEISYLEGFISTGIGLEGNTENAIIEYNKVSHLKAYKSSDRSGGGYDLNGLKFESNRYVATCIVKNNSFETNTFTHNVTSGLGYAVANYVPKGQSYTGGTTGEATLECNWFGTADKCLIIDNSTMTGKILNKDNCFTNFIPYLTNGTDNSALIGFQPVPGSCNGNSNGLVNNINTGKWFCTIQSAIDDGSTVNGHILKASTGTYAEQLNIQKSVELRGPNYGINPITGTRVGEAIITYPTGLSGSQSLIEIGPYDSRVNVNGVVIDGFTIDGSTYTVSASTTGIMGNSDGLVVKNNIIKNFNYISLWISSYVYENSNWKYDDYNNSAIIENNWIHNNDIFSGLINADIPFGIYLQGTYGTIKGNKVQTVRTGIQIQPYNHPNASALKGLVQFNTFEAYRDAMWYNYSENVNANWEFDGNKGTGIATPTAITEAQYRGFLVQTNYAGQLNFKNNNLLPGTNNATNDYGILFVNPSTTNANATISYNSITDFDYGVDIPASLAYVGNLTINFNSITGNSLYGVNNGTSTEVDAQYNWWGHCSGPGTVGPGTGDKVSTFVNYTPWLGNSFGDAALWLSPITAKRIGDERLANWLSMDCGNREAVQTAEKRQPIYSDGWVKFESDFGANKYGYSDVMEVQRYGDITATDGGSIDKWHPSNEKRNLFVTFKTGSSVDNETEPPVYYRDGRQCIFEAGGPLSGYNLYIVEGKLVFGMWNRFESKYTILEAPSTDFYPLTTNKTYYAYLYYDGSNFTATISDGSSTSFSSPSVAFSGLSQDAEDKSGIGGAARTRYHDYSVGSTYSDEFDGLLGDIIIYSGDFSNTTGVSTYLNARYGVPNITTPRIKADDWKIIAEYDRTGENNISSAYPNPFDSKTSIGINLLSEQNINVELLDVMGRKVALVFNGKLAAGIHDIEIDGTGLSNGIYFVKVAGETFTQTTQVILNK
jgi:hypothetical protein